MKATVLSRNRIVQFTTQEQFLANTSILFNYSIDDGNKGDMKSITINQVNEMNPMLNSIHFD